MKTNSSVHEETSSTISHKYLLQSVLSLYMTQQPFFLCVLIDNQTADSFARDIKAQNLYF